MDDGEAIARAVGHHKGRPPVVFELFGGPFDGGRAEYYGTVGVTIPIAGTDLYARYEACPTEKKYRYRGAKPPGG